MNFPLQITIRDIPPSIALENHIRRKVEKLMQFCDKIITFRTVVELVDKHHHQGKQYNVRLDISVPKDEIIINRIQNEDIYVAIRNAFNAAKRKLQTHLSKIHGHVKNHTNMHHGKIVRLIPGEDFGFIQTFDGKELYFHRNNMAYPNFEQLSIGMEVQFLEIVAGEGFQANRVSAGKHQTLETTAA